MAFGFNGCYGSCSAYCTDSRQTFKKNQWKGGKLKEKWKSVISFTSFLLPVLGYLLLPQSLPSLITAFLTGYGLILIGIAIEAITRHYPGNKEAR